jgi:hypothetical protein
MLIAEGRELVLFSSWVHLFWLVRFDLFFPYFTFFGNPLFWPFMGKSFFFVENWAGELLDILIKEYFSVKNNTTTSPCYKTRTTRFSQPWREKRKTINDYSWGVEIFEPTRSQAAASSAIFARVDVTDEDDFRGHFSPTKSAKEREDSKIKYGRLPH